MKRTVGIGIVAFWLVMVVLLARRTRQDQQPVAPPAPPPAASSLTHLAGESENWMGIYHRATKIGYFHRRVTPAEGGGYRWEEYSRMKLRVMDTTQTVHTEIRASVDPQYALKDFSFQLRSLGTTFQVTGGVKTLATGGQELQGQILSGKNPSPFSFPLQQPIYLPSITQMTLRNTTLRPGEERRYSIFNPLTMKTETISLTTVGPETLTLNGTQVATTKVAEQFGGTTVHAWLDAAGKVVKEEAAMGLVLLRESREEALGGGWQDNTPLDLVASTAIPVQQTLPDPRNLALLQLKIVLAGDSLSFAFPPRQQHKDGMLTVAREDESALTTYQLPQTNPEFAKDLAATPFLQSDHPRLRAQAQQTLGAERDAVKATHLLLDWTYNTLAKEPSVGIPTALEALDTKRGDCNEHAVLFTALARAAGLPSRVAAGVVYLNNAFYYHAWSEVWLGEWVAVDPAFRQFPADATHLKFIQGGPEEHLALLKVIGQVGMEVVEYK